MRQSQKSTMLSNTEFVVRSAFYPKMDQLGVIAPERVIANLQTEVDASGSKIYTVSVGSETLLTSWDAIHDYGQRTVSAINAANIERHKASPEKFVENFYVGSYRMSVGAIHGAGNNVFSLEVHSKPLPNLHEHCDIEARNIASNLPRIEVSAARTRIIAQLRFLLRDPQIRIRDEDLRTLEALSDIELSVEN